MGVLWYAFMHLCVCIMALCNILEYKSPLITKSYFSKLSWSESPMARLIDLFQEDPLSYYKLVYSLMFPNYHGSKVTKTYGPKV